MLILALLTGCGVLGGSYLSNDLACEHDVYDWWGGLTQHINYGSKSGDKIEWAYPPYEGWISRYLGNYDTESGDYTMRQQYVDEHYMESFTAVGYGTAYENGDLDLLHTVTEVDMLGEQTVYQVRHERTGCEGSMRTTWPEGVDNTPFTTTYTIKSPTQVEMLTSYDDVDYQIGKLVDSDFNVTGSIASSWEGGSYSASYTNDVDLNYSASWTQTTEDYYFVGTTSSDITGRTSVSYEVFSGDDLVASRSSTRNYDGSGTGTYEEPGRDLSCDITYRSNGSCTYDCGSQGTQDFSGDEC